MKRVINSIIATAMFGLAAVSFQSCQKDIVPEVENIDPNQLTATIANPGTKTLYEFEGTSKVRVTWKEGDMITLYRIGNDDADRAAKECEFSIQAGGVSDGGKKAIFTLTDAKGQAAQYGVYDSETFNYQVGYVAVYPSTVKTLINTCEIHSSADREDQLKEVYQFLNQTQEQVGNNVMTHLANYDYLKGIKYPGENNIRFFRMVSVLKLSIIVPSAVKSETPASIAVYGLWNEGSTDVRSYKLNLENVQYINCNQSGEDNSQGTYGKIVAYVTVPQVDQINGLTLNVEYNTQKGTGNSTTLETYKLSHKYELSGGFARGGMYACTFEVDALTENHSAEYVDLGLPSGTLWAKKNLGSSQEYPEGHYFQWGEVNGFLYNSDTRMVYNSTTGGYTPTVEAIEDNSCALYAIDNYATLNGIFKQNVNFTHIKESSDPGQINNWLKVDSVFLNLPDYQGKTPKYSVTSERTIITFTKVNINNVSSYGTYYGLVDGIYYELTYSGGFFGDNKWHYNYVSGFNKGPEYSGDFYTRSTSKQSKTEYKIVGDAARYQWGEYWHMPNAEQIQELLLYCDMSIENNQIVFTRKQVARDKVDEDYFKSECIGRKLTFDYTKAWEHERDKTPAWSTTNELRLQTSTAAKYGDANFSKYTGDGAANTGYCWELHYRYDNGGYGTYVYDLGLHSHHSCSTALPIRPVYVKKNYQVDN